MKKKTLVILALIITSVTLCLVLFLQPNQDGRPGTSSHFRLRLQYIPQAQFAGFLVADKMGFYREEGLDVAVLPAGPDLKPHVTVASGTDDIGVGVPNQVIAARSNGVPLVAIAQIFQDSANRYVLKKKNSIERLDQLKGRKVGLWLGGDEAEFISMLDKAKMTLGDVAVVSQGFSVAPFLQDEYVLSQVTTYNELQQIIQEVGGEDKLQIISPAQYGSAILGDIVFVTEKTINDRRDDLTKFVRASVRGWKYSITNPNETLEIILEYNKDLTEPDQRKQLAEVTKLVTAGDAKSKGIGYISLRSFENAQKILLKSKQIAILTDMKKAIDPSILGSVDSKIMEVR